MNTPESKIGRPRKHPAELMRPRQIRMTDAEWAILKDAAASIDKDVASWVRPLMLREARKVLRQAGN